MAHVDGALVMLGEPEEGGGQIALSTDGGASWQVTARTPHPRFAVTPQEGSAASPST